MATKFISDEFEKAININVIDATFPKLPQKQKDMLGQYLYGVIQMIASSYDFYKNQDNFDIKLRQNSYKDLRWLVTFLIPHVDQSKRTLRDLTDLEELYSLRYDTMSQDIKQKILELKVEDINLTAPKYVFSNLQYGRCVRGNMSEGGNKSIRFEEAHLRDNYYLLLDTIKTTRYKMYINWIDILPYRLDKYQTTKLFLDTKTKLDEKKYQIFDPVKDYPVEKCRDENQIKILNDMMRGLNIEDIYNTISIDLYESIVTYKWLLFDIGIHAHGKIIILSAIQLLNIVMSLHNIINNLEWETLIDSSRDRFIREWDALIYVFSHSTPLVNSNISVPANAIKTLMKSIIVFFDKKYTNINSLVKDKKYKPLGRKGIQKDVDDYDERMKDVKEKDAIDSLQSIEYSYIYDFLKEVMQGFKTTWYSKYLMNPEKTEIVAVAMQNGYKIIDDVLSVSFKNIYNYCKNMVHEKRPVVSGKQKKDQWYSEEYVKFPSTWAGLSSRIKQIIINRMNDDNNTSRWFNISRNIWNVVNLANPLAVYKNEISKINSNMNKIYVEIRSNITHILFETMISRGTMSYMVAENDLTNNALYDMAQPAQKKSFVNLVSRKRFYNGNPYGDNSFYYLTNKLFKDTGTYYVKLDNEPEDCDYFKFCSTVSTAWYVSTTYHWIAQIGFCHRFINNRVNFVTGGTGAGKSTQVPKMYLYYLKAIDRVESPTVIITVPRTNVASGVSGFVSQELAVPYQEFDKETKREKKSKNANYYIQYQHMKDDHVDSGIYPKIRFITDGSVLLDAKDPLIKNKRLVKDDENPDEKNDRFVYRRSNKYDVVIVDEAHEHNANMDMILSLMRNSIHNNNKMRFVIMSATMDADEPVYRRFYRDINDNRKYPLSEWIREHKIDRINTERRFHISPPDETTRFKITEIYRPGEDADEIVKEIVKTSLSGDILLFRPGTADIGKSLMVLNALNVLPDDVIALPYHAQLPRHVREFIDKIDKNLKSLRMSKDQDIASLSQNGLITGTHTYKRCIVVATNIAEASISITTLRYVVETGLEKTMRFDFERRSNVLKANYITEASRLQRKGRVGRVAPGTVYYTYKKGSLENNRKQFNISVQDNHPMMMDMIRELGDVPIMSELTNALIDGRMVQKTIKHIINKHEADQTPDTELTNLDMNNGSVILNESNMRKLLTVDYKDLFNKHGIEITSVNKKKSPVQEFIEGIIDVIIDHYFGDKIFYEYVGNHQINDYSKNKRPYPIYSSGFDVEQLTDSSGEYYIVHPDELVISRNIMGEIIETDGYGVLAKRINSGYVVSMLSNKIIVFWETLLNQGFIGVTSDTKQLYRTALGNLLQHCTKNMLTTDYNHIKILFFGFGIAKTDEEFEQILNLVTMLSVIGLEPLTKSLMDRKTLEKYATNPKLKKTAERKLQSTIKNTFRDKNGTVKSDLMFLLNICKVIDTAFQTHNVKYNLFTTSYLENDKYMEFEIKGIKSGLPPNLKRTKDDLKKRNEILFRISDAHRGDLIKFIAKYTYMFNGTGIGIEQVVKFVSLREELRLLWNDLKIDIKNAGDTRSVNFHEIKDLLKQHRSYMDELNVDIVKASLLFAKPYSIHKKISSSASSYISLYNPHIDTIMSVPPNDTFVDAMFCQDYILNLNEKLDRKTMSVLVEILPNDLNLLANIYNKREMRRKFSDAQLTSQKLHLHVNEYLDKLYNDKLFVDESQPVAPVPVTGPGIDFRNYSAPEHLLSITNISKTIEDARPCIDEIQHSKIWAILNSLGVGYEDYGKLLRI
jgi:hypothetical protein